MEAKFNHHLLSCIFLLFLLNPFQCFSSSYPSHQISTPQTPSPLDYLKSLIGTKKGTRAKGLPQLKTYLSNLGYMKTNTNSTNSDQSNNDLFNDNLEIALKKYQTFFKLQTSGILDFQTVSKLLQPRCGIPDNFDNIKNTNDNNKINSTIMSSLYTYFPGQPKWAPTKRNLTYSFPPITRNDIRRPIANALGEWARVTLFTFRYIQDYNKADIKISFQVRDHGDGHPFDGPGGTLAHAYLPSDGRLHYDGDEKWVDGVVPGATDLQTVGLHELGHVLGLQHSTDPSSIMWPTIGPGFRKDLGQDDIRGIKALYGFP
ncbi:hypothetical protein ACJIZ3_012034 [Penstemon smallii]|uniref:Peptidase metallopeptidase domain-containing protein n=1 Tax=Penstemon smallii TaxID=265156 RepID=A0ABD3UM32_9LAMI